MDRRQRGDLLSLILSVLTIYMVWKGLCVISGSSSPVHVVISESMAPAFHRGDLLVMWNRTRFIEVGDIPVCWFDGQVMPMVHRAVRVYNTASESQGEAVIQHILTKGDNNELTDESIYPGDRDFVHRAEVVGIVKGYVPYIGWFAILLSMHPWLRTAALAALIFASILL